jgi:hypothetical protein
MAGVPSIEKCPEGLSTAWSGVWRQARDEMKDLDTFSASMRPLLDEYVYALKAAQDARVGFRWLDALEEYADDADELPEIAWSVLRRIAEGLPAMWDRHTKRAMELAGTLGLTPKAQKALSVKLKEGGDAEPDNPFAGLDEVAQKRQAKAG